MVNISEIGFEDLTPESDPRGLREFFLQRLQELSNSPELENKSRVGTPEGARLFTLQLEVSAKIGRGWPIQFREQLTSDEIQELLKIAGEYIRSLEFEMSENAFFGERELLQSDMNRDTAMSAITLGYSTMIAKLLEKFLQESLSDQKK